MRRCVFPLLIALLLGACSIPRWPVDGTVTSPYGLRHRGFLDFQIHRGIDISVPSGTPVRAMSPGVVEFAGTMAGYGNVIIIDHGRNVRSLYGHLSELRVRTGEEVSGRPVIALSGATGQVTGPHLHFEILRRGKAEDPVPLLGGFPPAGR